jgi:hypothetical protein
MGCCSSETRGRKSIRLVRITVAHRRGMARQGCGLSLNAQRNWRCRRRHCRCNLHCSDDARRACRLGKNDSSPISCLRRIDMFPGVGAVSERVPQETGAGKVGALRAFAADIRAGVPGRKSPISHIMRVLFQDYGPPPLRRASLLARRLVRSSVQLAVVPPLLHYVANFRD